MGLTSSRASCDSYSLASLRNAAERAPFAVRLIDGPDDDDDDDDDADEEEDDDDDFSRAKVAGLEHRSSEESAT